MVRRSAWQSLGPGFKSQVGKLIFFFLCVPFLFGASKDLLSEGSNDLCDLNFRFPKNAPLGVLFKLV